MRGIRRTATGLRRLPPLVWVVSAMGWPPGWWASLGGFAAAPDGGRLVGPGERVLTQRWQINVDEATLIDDSPDTADPAPAIRVRLRIEFTGNETLCCIPDRMLEVRCAGQVVTQTWKSDDDPRSITGYDPRVHVRRVLEFPLDAAALPKQLPDSVDVVVRDERPSRSLILDDWGVSTAVATARLPCLDERSRR